MFFGLGELSGLYSKDGKTLTQSQTDSITTAIEQAITSVGVHRHKWTAGSLLMLDNLALAHKASPGTQNDDGDVRILRRVTLAGKRPLRRRSDFKDYPKKVRAAEPVQNDRL